MYLKIFSYFGVFRGGEWETEVMEMLGKLAVMDAIPVFIWRAGGSSRKTCRYSHSVDRDSNLRPPGYGAGGIATRLRR
jgi:hypothetical protein